jgi:general secretion pathway protein A
MYESHFGFTEKPFSLLPDPSFLYFGKQHSSSFAMLEYGLANQAGFTVLTGEIGCGKTTLLRHLLDKIEDNVTVGLISNTHPSFGELLQWVHLAFSLEYKGKNNVELYQSFVDFVIAEYAKGRRTVLIIDEAQNMRLETLEELRMLSNINADKDQVLQLILVGQPELRGKLQAPELVQFAQRVAVDFHLEHLGPEETRAYIRHRVTRAGGDASIFRPDTYGAVHHATGGVPRLINVLCDTALVYAFSEGRKRVGVDLIEEVSRDREKLQATSMPVERTLPFESSDSRITLDLDVDTVRELFGRARVKTDDA